MRIAFTMKQVVAAAVAGAMFALGFVTSALAECPYAPTFPGALRAAPTAKELIVGTVTETVDGAPAFRLRIDHVLRGDARVGDVREVRGLLAGWPIDHYANGSTSTNCTELMAGTGEVIAIAYDALAPDGKTRYNAAAWLSPKAAWMESVQHATLAELRAAAAGLPATDVPASAGTPGPVMEPWKVGVLVGSALVGVLMVDRRRTQRPA